MQPTGNREDAMAAFRDRAMRRSPIPVPGVSEAPAGGAPTPGQPSPTGQPSPFGQPSQPPKETDILRKVAGKVTEPEMIEVLIRRLKDLMPKEKPQGGTASA